MQNHKQKMMSERVVVNGFHDINLMVQCAIHMFQ